MTSENELDPFPALRALVGRQVAFIIVGGIAGRLLGSPTITRDLDVCYSRDRVNLRRLAEALEWLDARLRGAPDDVPFQLDAEGLERGSNFTFVTTAGPLDVLGEPARGVGYSDLLPGAIAMDLDEGLHVLVCDIDDLIAMKRAAGRPKDLIEVEVLEAVREEREHHIGP